MPERLTQTDIEKVIPHRYPFRFVRSATILEPGKRGKGMFVDLLDPVFDTQGIFKDLELVPRTIITEAMAQMLGITASSGQPQEDDKVGLFAAIPTGEFKRDIKPGKNLTLYAHVLGIRMGIVKGEVKAMQARKLVAKGQMTFALVDKSTLGGE